MKIILRPYFIIFFSLATLFACKEASQDKIAEANISSNAIPGLLSRPENLGSPEEQKYIKESYQRLSETITNYPDNLEAHFKLAQLFMLEARVSGEHGHYYPAALEVIEKTIAKAQKNEDLFEANFLKASVLLSLHQFDQALIYGEKAVKYNPYNSLAFGTLVDAYVELGNYTKAAEMADKMVSLRPDLRSYARVSYIRELYGDIDGAIEAMKMAVEAGYPGYEDKAWCRLTLGNLYETYGDLHNADLQYQIALEERENYPFAIAALGGLEKKKGNLNKAILLLDSAISIIPEVSFYEKKAEILAEKEEQASLNKLVQEILEMLKDDERSGHNMGLTFSNIHRNYLKNPLKAREYAQKEYEMRSDNIETNLEMASIAYELKEFEISASFIEKAMRTDFQKPELLCLAGLIKYKNGNEKEGIRLIKSSFSYNPYQNHSFVEEAKSLIGS